MCYRDLLAALLGDGVTLTESQIRWAIHTGKVTRPPLDGSLRFNFQEEHLHQLRQLFRTKVQEAAKC